MNRVTFFELGVLDVNRAATFYESVFGWQAESMPGPEDYRYLRTGPDSEPGINGGMLRNKDGQPRTVNSMQVDSIEETAKRVEAAGGSVVVPRFPVAGVGYRAFCVDTEGNLFGVHEIDKSAS